MTRIPPELHREVNIAARVAGKSLNAWVTEQLEMAVSGPADAKKSRKRATPVAKRLKRPSRGVAGRRK